MLSLSLSLSNSLSNSQTLKLKLSLKLSLFSLSVLFLTTDRMAAAARFDFQPQLDELPTLARKEVRDVLAKWSLDQTLRGQRFTFDQPYHSYDLEAFVKSFFASPAVQQKLQLLATVNGSWVALGHVEAEKVEYEHVATAALTMSFFDRLYEHEIIRKNGAIKMCVPEWVDGYEIPSELAKCLIMAEDESFDIFDEDERGELIFQLFTHLVYGGPLNQYEDSIGPYFDTTRDLYKDLVSVARDPKGELYVNSVCVKVTAVDDRPLFPTTHPVQNALYLIINPGKKTVNVLYNAWCGN